MPPSFMITVCNKCGGLRADPGEMFGGNPCQCAVASEPTATITWNQRCKEMEEHGRLLGLLEGCLFWNIPEELKGRIKTFLTDQAKK